MKKMDEDEEDWRAGVMAGKKKGGNEIVREESWVELEEGRDGVMREGVREEERKT